MWTVPRRHPPEPGFNMKVLIVSPYSWSVPGGVGAHVGHLARALRERGHEVRIVAPSEGDVEPGVVSVGRSIPIPYNGSIARLAFGPRVALRIRVALRRARPDIVHVHEPFAPSVGLLALLNTRLPVVGTFHASIARSRAYRIAGPALRPLYRRLAARIAVSEEARRTVEQVFGKGDVTVIPNGVEWSRFSSLPPPSGSLILFVGRMEKRKGAAVLVEAFTRLAERRPDAELVLAGEGPERATVEKAIPEVLRDRVMFTGRVDPAELAEVFGRAAVVAAPSLGGESFGIVLLEAMSAGRPVVASSIPGYAAVVRDGVDGVLVPPGDPVALAEALDGVLADAAKARAMGEAGRERARRYDWPVVAAEVEAVYMNAIATGRPSRRKRR
jgi:phosphatidylinositol alpha-mannosyltransferase